MCASLNHRKKIKAGASADFSKVFAVNRELSIVDVRTPGGLFFRADAGCSMRIAHL